MSMSPRARRAGAAGAMEVASSSSWSSSRKQPSSTRPATATSLVGRVLVFAVAIGMSITVWRSRSVSDDLWREGRRAPPAGYCARVDAASAASPSSASSSAPPPQLLPLTVCAHAGVDGVRGRNSRPALKAAAEAFDCVELDVSAALTGELLALHGRRSVREELEWGQEEPPRRPSAGAFVGDFTLGQLRGMRWRRVRAAPRELGRLRGGIGGAVVGALPGSRPPPRARRPEDEGPLLVSQALDAVLATWAARDEARRRAGAGRGHDNKPALPVAERTLILDVKRPEGAAASNVTFDRVADAAARAAAEAGCGSRCVLWSADDAASRALAEAVGRHGGGGEGEEAEGAAGRPRVGYVVAFAGQHQQQQQQEKGAPPAPETGEGGEGKGGLVPRLEGVAHVAAVDVAALGGGESGARRGEEAKGSERAAFERAGQTLVAFVVDGGRALRVAAAGSGAHAVVTDEPVAVSNVLSSWRRRC